MDFVHRIGDFLFRLSLGFISSGDVLLRSYQRLNDISPIGYCGPIGCCSPIGYCSPIGCCGLISTVFLCTGLPLVLCFHCFGECF